MKQGNQFWYGIKLKDKNKEYLNPIYIDKIIFNFDELQKEYNSDSKDVVFDKQNNLFKIYLTQEETQQMQNKVNIDVRVKFKNDEILGTAVTEQYIFESLNKEVI
jgi:queuine/archaeosine tRNA-ribosyltransferase